MSELTGEVLCKRYEALGAEHGKFKNIYDTCLFYFMPEAQGLSNGDSSEGEKDQPFDFTGVHSQSRLSSGLFSNTVSMGDQFFGFRANDRELEENNSIVDYFTEGSKVLLQSLQDSNFPLESYEMMSYYCSLMTAVFYSDYNESEQKLSFQNFPITSCRIAEDEHGKVRTIYREFELTAEAALGKFGDELPKSVIDKAKSDDQRYEKVKFFHYVGKNPKAGEKTSQGKKKLASEFKQFISYYVHIEDKKIVEESGYDTFPYAIPRFQKIAGSPYGRGPAFSAIPAMRELNALRADMLDGIELGIQPPVLVPDSMELDDVDLSPGSIIPFNNAAGSPTFWESTIHLGDAAKHRESVKEEVKDLFYVNLFMMLEQQKNMTATEVSERVAEKVQAITPVITRLYDEFFSEVLGRCFFLLVEHGKIDKFPDELKGKDITIAYQTKLDNKLKSLDTNQLMAAFQSLAQLSQMSQVDPEFKHIVNLSKCYQRIMRNFNVDPDLLLDAETAEKNKAAEAEAMAQAQAAQQAMDKINLAPIDLQSEEGMSAMPTIPDLMPGG